VRPLGQDLGLNLAQPYDITAPPLQAANTLGVRWVRTIVEYGQHATQTAADAAIAAAGSSGLWPTMVTYQQQFALAHASGCKVLVACQGSLSWLRGADRTDGGNPFHQAPLPSKRSYFAEFVRQLALAGCDAIEFWNEPNFKASYWFGPDHPRVAHQDERGDDYVMLLRAVYARVKGDPLTSSVPIGIGAPGIIGHELMVDPSGIHQTLWYQRLFNATSDDRVTPVSASGAFDFCCCHPYADVNSNRGPLDWGGSWLSANDAAYWHGMASVYRMRQHVINAGHSSAKWWATEVGAPTNSNRSNDLTVSEQTQAQWTRDYAEAWFSTDSSGYSGTISPVRYGAFTETLIVYQLTDKSNGKLTPATDGTIEPKDREGYFGIVRYDGSTKAAYAALMAIARGSRVSAWWTARQERIRLARLADEP
jgi:hypothetical protein